MGRQFAGVLGLLAFLVLVVRALLHGSGAAASLPMACGVLFVFAALGWVVGTIAQQTVDQSVQFTFDQQLQANDSTGKSSASNVETA